MIWKSFFLFILINFVSIYGLRNCWIDGNHYECKLSSKTPYRYIANYDDSPINYPGCTEKKIWFLIRHGTRYPGKKYTYRSINELPEIQKLILNNYNAKETTLEASFASKLIEWKVSFDRDRSMNLAEEGENEMIDLAERFQSRFPNLLTTNYNNHTYKFKYTATQRAEESGKHFALGLFGMKKSLNVSYEKEEYRDPILRFYKNCKRWRKDIYKRPAATKERDKFITSKIVENMLIDISNRVGEKLDFNTVLLIYLACSYETAWSADSPWCNLFSLQDFEILDYSEDLLHYWNDGYAFPLNYEQACLTLKDTFDFFQSKEGPSVVAYFTHSGALSKLLCLLGVFKDEMHLTSDSFLSHKDNRNWRLSLIDAFASNIAFILYECKSQGPSILFMHQERVVQLPNCPKNMPCPISIMKNTYPDNEEECKFDEMCSINET